MLSLDVPHTRRHVQQLGEAYARRCVPSVHQASAVACTVLTAATLATASKRLYFRHFPPQYDDGKGEPICELSFVSAELRRTCEFRWRIQCNARDFCGRECTNVQNFHKKIEF